MRFVTVQGPTASGKTALALKLAQELDTEIISADSRQVYRYMDIGTAKPTRIEMTGIRHHLIDVVDPDESYSAGRFAQEALSIVQRLNDEGKIPVVAGGTGFYIRALQNGLFESPEVDPELRARLMSEAEQDIEEVYRRLVDVDPESAERVHRNDAKRIVRALEIFEQTGISMSEHWRRQQEENRFVSYDILLQPDREDLYKRINDRFDYMIINGFLDEVKRLLEMGYKPDDPGMNAVGYRELVQWQQNGGEIDAVVALAKQKSRNYAKRQMTWYRSVEFDLTLDSADINIYSVAGAAQEKLAT